MSEKAELKPCPFCGEVPEAEDDDGALHKGKDCWIGTVFIEAFEAPEWNRRADLAWLPPELAFAIREVLSYAHNGVVEHDATLLRDILAWQESLK